MAAKRQQKITRFRSTVIKFDHIKEKFSMLNNHMMNRVSSSNLSHSNNNENHKVLIPQIVQLLRSLNLRLIAFDFDYTIVSIHTGGQWLDSPSKLAEFVRPCFRDLIPALLQCNDFHVCVVTYSPQEKLIKDVLKISMKNETENM